MYRDIFSVPNTWRKEIQKIEESVYRQIRQHIQSHVAANPAKRGNLDIFGVRDLLDDILCSLFNDQGLEQWRFPMTWHLVAVINQEITPAVHSSTQINLENYELLKDIAVILKQDMIIHPAHQRSDVAQKREQHSIHNKKITYLYWADWISTSFRKSSLVKVGA